MGSTAASATFQTYRELIRSASIHPNIYSKPESVGSAEHTGDWNLHRLQSVDDGPGADRKYSATHPPPLIHVVTQQPFFNRRLTYYDILARRRSTVSSLQLRLASVIPPPVPPSRSPSGSDAGSRGSQYSENLGRVKWDELPLKHGDGDIVLDVEETPSEKETLWQKTVNFLKIMAPHVGLNIILLSYIGIGAAIFMFLEAENELSQRRNKLKQILHVYQLILNETVSICSNGPVNSSTVERRMKPLLSVLSRTHEYDDRFTREDQMWTDSEESLTTKWTFASSVLYGLTVITSTGYDHLTPTTDAGRIFTVFFGLLGIPLMFITAADIGKFLSDIVIRFYGTMLSVFSWIASVMDAIKDYIKGSDETSIDSSYFALVIGYCSLGSLLFNAFEKGAIWSYVHGVFFSFNTITTIGLGNIRVQSTLYLALTVAYVIIGLAVITASLDLCSSTLKRTFTKLHYFGRKIRGARKGFANMSDDIREAMKIIAALKKTRPSKERITLEDLKRFLEVQEHLLRQPYVPYNVDFFKWIEDAYAQYFDDNASISSKQMQKALQSLPNHEPFLVF